MLEWNYEPYQGEYKKCLIAFIPDFLSRTSENICIENGWSGNGKNMYNAFAWAEYPDDIIKGKDNWESVYFGDEEPKDGMYLLSLHKKQKPYKRHYQYWSPNKSEFSEGVEVMAWQKVNKPKLR